MRTDTYTFEFDKPDNCIDPFSAIDEMQRRHSKLAREVQDWSEIDPRHWGKMFKQGEVQRRSWKRYILTYYDHSEEKSELELSTNEYSEKKQTAVDPFNEDTVTKYENISLNLCTECGGDGTSKCETCNGDGEMDCPDANCDGGQIIVDCGCYGGEIEGDCPHCSGTGRTYVNGSRTDCSECYGRGTEGKMCPDCKGKGTQNKGQCEICSTEPPIDTLGVIRCKNCSPPSHKTTCITCEGEGKTYQGIEVIYSYKTRTETVVEDEILFQTSPLESKGLFERHVDCVASKEYETCELPYNQGISDSAKEAEEFHITEQELNGYVLPYEIDNPLSSSSQGRSVDQKSGEAVVISDKVYGRIPIKEQFYGNMPDAYNWILFGLTFGLASIPIYLILITTGHLRAYLILGSLFIIPIILFYIWDLSMNLLQSVYENITGGHKISLHKTFKEY